MLRALFGAIPEPNEVKAPDLDFQTTPDWGLDPGAPAAWEPPTPEQQFSDLVPLLRAFLEANTPGVPGVEGAEQWPELAFDAFTVQSDVIMRIPGNHRRTSLLVHNLGPGIVYVVPRDATDTSKGMPIPVNAEREIRTSQEIRLMASAASQVRSLEESS